MHHSCGNGSCCSPSKLWRQIQTIVRTGNEQDFVRLCGDGRAPHVARVLLSQRLVNDPAMYPASNKHRVLQLNLPHQQLVRLFGTSVRDLNGLQMALFLRNEVMARTILEFLQDTLSPKELCQFVNHTWGQKNSSLHLAAYWGMVSLVRLLLECGADSTHRNARQRGPWDGCTNLACIQLLQPSSINTTTTTATTATATATTTTATTTLKRRSSPMTPTPTPTMATPLPRTSMLLKKAVQHVAELPMDSLLTGDHYQQQHQHLRHRITPIVTDNNNKPPLIFSSSTSSSSLSSLEEPSSPGSPLLFLSSKSPRQPPTPDLVLLNEEDDDDDDDDSVDYHEKRRQQQCWTPPSPSTPPLTPLSPTSGYHGDHDDNIDDDNNDDINDKRRMVSFSPNPMDHPTPICHRPVRPPFPLRSPPPPIRSPSVVEDDDDDDENNDDNGPEILPPSPTLTSAPPSLTGIMCNDKKKKEINTSSVKPKIKSVRFSPDIVLLDACVSGDVGDLKHLIKQQQQQQPTKATSVILQEWQQQHFANTSSSTAPSSMLHIALLHRQEKMAHYLVSLGADVNATDQDGWTPLHYAATLQLWSTVDALAHHPDILLNTKTNNGLRVYDCPRALVDQRKCRTIIERATRKHQHQHQRQQQQQQRRQQEQQPLPQHCLV